MRFTHLSVLSSMWNALGFRCLFHDLTLEGYSRIMIYDSLIFFEPMELYNSLPIKLICFGFLDFFTSNNSIRISRFRVIGVVS